VTFRAILSIRTILLLAVAVHLDWHVGRAEHFRLSLGWPYHWLMGVPGVGLAAWYAARRWERLVVPFLLNVGVALVLGQLIEPVLEALVYGDTLASVFPVDRWRIFVEFTAAGLLAGAAVLWLHRVLVPVYGQDR
jgi:hypothetical protein